MARTGAARTTCAKVVVGNLSLLTAFLIAQPASAADLEPVTGFSLDVHGFASQGLIFTVGNDYLARDSTEGSFEFSEIGLNFTKDLTEKLRMGVQFFAQDLGPSGNYNAKADWFYLDYRFDDWLGLRVGRLKIPYGLHNEVQDIDAARVSVLLPQSVYPLQGREILFAHTGAELYGFLRSKHLGALEYRWFGGTIFLDSESLRPPGATFDVDLRIPLATGGRLLWETPLNGLRFGGSIERVHLDTTAFVPSIAPIEIENRSWLWVAFAEYGVADLMLTAEYSRWDTKQRSNQPMLSPPLDILNERAYAMASYRVAPWLQPGAYYSIFFPDVHDRTGRENYQHDLAGTLRFDINAHWIVKVEGHFMAGTAGLLNPLRLGEVDLSQADRYWTAYFLKTTAHF